jgi:hypothetical protein
MQFSVDAYQKSQKSKKDGKANQHYYPYLIVGTKSFLHSYIAGFLAEKDSGS